MPRRLRLLVDILVLAVVEFGAVVLGLALAFHTVASPVWPPTGVAFAALFLRGRRLWPGVFTGAWLGNMLAAPHAFRPLVLAAGSTLEALVAVALVERWLTGHGARRQPFACPQDVWAYVFLAGGLATSLSATLGVATLLVTDGATWQGAGLLWLTWWLGNMGGALVVAPVVILWARRPQAALPAGDTAELVALGVVEVASAVLVFGPGPLGAEHWPVAFLTIPFLVWAASRYPPREAATMTALLAIPAVIGTYLGLGPFAVAGREVSLVVLQGFLIVVSMSALILSSAASSLREARVEADERARVMNEVAATLRDVNEDLVRSNRDLDAFAQIVSHDLKSPLRTVGLFAERLQATVHEEPALELVSTVRSGVRHMSALIDDLLDWSRVGRRPLRLAPVALSDLVDDVLALLRPEIEARHAEITVGPLPTVTADASLLSRVVQNLIENALKFAGDAPPRVEITARRVPGAWEIALLDRGIGFSPDDAEAMFEPFHRLEGASGAPGSGLGLAIVRRVVERHGGHIAAAPRPDGGAAFRFTLPDRSR